MTFLGLVAVASIPFALGGCAAVGTVLATHSASAAIAAAADYAPVALAAGVVGAIGISGVAGIGRETSEPGTFGAFLQDSQSQVRAQIDRGMQNQREALVVAGLQAQGALARARLAFKDSLNKKMTEVAGPEAGFRKDMEPVLNNLAMTSNGTVKEAGDRAQMIADRLRSAERGPQVNSFGPIFLFPSLPFQSVKVKGNFPGSYEGSMIPQMNVNGKTLKAFDFRPDSLSFSLLTADLGVDEPQEIVWKRAQVTVPWNKPLFDRFSSEQVEKFDVELGVLPYSFGRATMDHQIVMVRREEKVRLSDSFSFDTSEAPRDAETCLTLLGQEISEGWKIVPGSSAVVVDKGGEASGKSDGPHMALQTQNDSSVCWQVRAGADGSPADVENGGIRVLRVSARIAREVNETGIASESFDLGWGSKRSFAYPAGTWKLRYSKFGASAVEVDSADLSSPLIRISSDGRSVMVSTYPH